MNSLLPSKLLNAIHLPPVERSFRFITLWILYGVTAAIVLNIFLVRWGYRDEDARFSFERMITHTAHRPFVYRVMTPALVNSMVQITPRSIVDFVEGAEAPAAEGELRTARQNWMHERYRFIKERYNWADGYALHRLYTYFILFACLFGLQILLAKLGATYLEISPQVRVIAPVIALLMLPLSFQKGGYFYDFPQLFLVTLAVLLAAKRKWLTYYFVFALAVLNKQTAALLVLAPLALYYRALPIRRWIAHGFIHVAIAAPLFIIIRMLFAPNGGSMFELHMATNKWYYYRLGTYFASDDIYAPFLFFPVLFNVLAVALVLFFIFYRWAEKPAPVRRLLIVYVCLLTPLLVLGGWRNEVRVYYLAAPAFYILALHTAYLLFGGAAGGKPQPPSEAGNGPNA